MDPPSPEPGSWPVLDPALKIALGVFWLLAYALLIRRNALDRTIAMPLPALAVNIVWEFIFCFVFCHKPPIVFLEMGWFALDVVLLIQCLRYGREAYAWFLPPKLLYPAVVLALVTAGAGLLTFIYSFEDWNGHYSGWMGNLLMSILFSVMLLQRKSVAGQSLYIAMAKMLGSLAVAVLLFLRFPEAVFLHFLCGSVLVYDLIYIVLLYQKCRELGLNPWTRL
jgi:hypothetical protein